MCNSKIGQGSNITGSNPRSQAPDLNQNFWICSSVVEPEPRAEIKLDPVIFYHCLKLVAEEDFVNCYNFNPISQSQKGNFQGISAPAPFSFSQTYIGR
jgi:hypothetical protein